MGAGFRGEPKIYQYFGLFVVVDNHVSIFLANSGSLFVGKV